MYSWRKIYFNTCLIKGKEIYIIKLVVTRPPSGPKNQSRLRSQTSHSLKTDATIDRNSGFEEIQNGFHLLLIDYLN